MFYNLTKANQVFDQLTRARSKWDVFQSILDFALIPHRWYDTGEALQAAHRQLTENPDKDAIVQFLTHLADLQPEGFQDPLGDFYMEHFANSRLGQYFTPENLTDAMAKMPLGKTAQPGQTVLDPACGSARTLLAAAKINRHLRFYGADLDPTCCKMAVYNMMLNSLTGEIAHMNSLSNEFFRGYTCRTKFIDGHHYPYFIEFTDPNNSFIWLRPPVKPTPEPAKPFDPKPVPPTSTAIQGTLF